MPAEKLVAQDIQVSNAGDTAPLNAFKAEFVGCDSEVYYTVSTRFYTARYASLWTPYAKIARYRVSEFLKRH